jgi:uncharacterized membrane protein
MDFEDVFPGFVIAGLAVLAALALGLKAVVDAGRVRAQLAALTEKFWMMDHRLVRLTERIDQFGAPGEAAPVAEPIAPIVPEPAGVPGEAVGIAGEPPAAPDEPAVPDEPAIPETLSPQPAAAPGRNWEQILVENWLVWLGGATIALGGAFFVKLSIDYGLLTPLVRVVLGVLLGIALSFGAEWVKRRDEAQDAETPASGPGVASYVPQALAAAGAATVFASLYAAHALYGFLPAGVAFALLAVTAGAAVAQSLRHGPLVAALGLVGAYAVPALVSSDAPQALPLFAYLAVVTAASLAVLRHRAWWWLAWLSLAGAVGYVVLWLGSVSDPETPVVAGYLLVQFGLFVAFRHGIARIGFLAGVVDSPIVLAVTRVAFWAIALGLLVLAHADRFGTTSVAAAILLTIGLMVVAYRDSRLDDVIAVAGVLALALLASWNLPMPTEDWNVMVFRLQPDHVTNFSVVAVVFTLLLGLGGYLVLPMVARPGRWAALSAAVPLLVLVIAYWRLQKFELDIAWTLTALALAGLELGGAATMAKRRTGDIEIEIALASYAVGILGSTIFAATLALGQAWFTVALALHLPAMGWIEGRIRLPVLRWLALGVAGTVLIRLILNPYVLDYPLGPTPIFNWLLYGYGVPAASFIVATRLFGSRADDLLVAVLEAGSILFSLALLSLELTHAVYGDLRTVPLEDFGAGAGLIAVWLVFAGVAIAVGEWRQRPVLLWGGWLILGATTIVAVIWQLVMLLFGVRVGNLMIVDALLLADAVPALVYAVVAWQSPHRPVLRAMMRVLAAIYAFVWITLEIQHGFHAKVELFHSSTEAEWYLYSVAWLAYAGVALAGGLLWRNQWLRRAGLIGIGLVILKVFLSDMDELSGVLRALSFLGLGAALVGLGYAYRRFRPTQP